MDQNVFWCITLSTIVLVLFYKHLRNKAAREKAWSKPEEKRSYTADQRQAEYDELKKKGYDDELIAVILPTINNGQ